MRRSHGDFETRSEADLGKVGADAYAQHWSTSPLMLAWYTEGGAMPFGPELNDFFADPEYVRTRYPHAKPGDAHFKSYKPPCPPAIREALEQGDIVVAHNARFEQAIWYWICHLEWGWPWPQNWSCTAARARYWGIRASLDGAASDLEVPHQKNADGKQFINDFCKPRKYKGAKKLGIIKETWYEPHEQPELYAKGKQYCRDDVLAELDVDKLLPDLPPFEQRIWELDFRINTRGLPIDIQSVQRAILFSDHYTAVSNARFDEITALRPTQRDRVLEYINQREEIAELGDLRSKTLKRIVMDDLPHDLQDVINIRLETSKASIRKLETMVRCTDGDGRARGLFLYGGAHTLRWSAKRIQPQNFTRPDMELHRAIFEYLEGEFWPNVGMIGHNQGPPLDELPEQPQWVAEAGIRFPRPLGALAKAMRGFIKAPDGKRFVSGDYAQIEARVLAWLARCGWLVEAFRNKDDVYTRFAAQYMYPNEMRSYDECVVIKNGKPKVLPQWGGHRQKAKSAQLGCGFQVSGRTFVEYCDNIDLIISLEEANEIVKKYRAAHPEIANFETGLWSRVERAAILAAGNEGHRTQLTGTDVSFHVHRIDAERYWLVCTLPSGRHIAYYRPKIRLGERFGRTVEKLSFRTEWNGKSYREDTYGGKLVENIVQGTARDICAVGALNVETAGYTVVGLVHDEVITLPAVDHGSADHLAQLMCALPPWITDLPVEAEGSEMVRYGK
jgi:DNA polymerase